MQKQHGLSALLEAVLAAGERHVGGRWHDIKHSPWIVARGLLKYDEDVRNAAALAGADDEVRCATLAGMVVALVHASASRYAVISPFGSICGPIGGAAKCALDCPFDAAALLLRDDEGLEEAVVSLVGSPQSWRHISFVAGALAAASRE